MFHLQRMRPRKDRRNAGLCFKALSLLFCLVIFTLTVDARAQAQVQTQLRPSGAALAKPKPRRPTRRIASVGAQPLSLRDAMRNVFLNNREHRQQILALKAAKNSFQDSWDTMFLPGVSISAQSASYYTVGQLSGTTPHALGDVGKSTGYPTSVASLSLGSYTLFNFWKDWLTYESARLSYKRIQEQYNEYRRSLKFQVILTYFSAKTNQDKLDAAKRSLDIAQAIVLLVKSRRKLNRATDSDVSSSVVDLLTAKNTYTFTAQATQTQLANLNLLMAEEFDAPFRLTTDLKYALFKMDENQATDTYLENGPNMKSAKLSVKNAELQVESAEKNSLPLPTVTFSGITLSYGNGYFGGTNTRTTSSAGMSGNLDVGIAVGLTLPLVGPGGIFNTRTMDTARISRDSAELGYHQTAARDQVQIYDFIWRIRQQEGAIANNLEALTNSAKLLDDLFARISREQVSRLELRDALDRTRLIELGLKDSILSHLSDKLSLAALIGMDSLPGDPY